METQIDIRESACYICLSGYFFALMKNSRLDLPLHVSVFRKTLKDLQICEYIDSPKRDCVLYITFRIFFRTDHEFEVGFAYVPIVFR